MLNDDDAYKRARQQFKEHTGFEIELLFKEGGHGPPQTAAEKAYRAAFVSNLIARDEDFRTRYEAAERAGRLREFLEEYLEELKDEVAAATSGIPKDLRKLIPPLVIEVEVWYAHTDST